MVGTYDGNSLRFFENGYLVEEKLENLEIGYSDLSLRIGQANSGLNFKGNIDDIRIYNRALSEAEIQALYNEGQRATNSLAMVPVHAKLVAPSPQLTINPPTINFGNVLINEFACEDVTLTNTGTAPLVIDSVLFNEPFYTAYSGGTIPPGGSETIEVCFAPPAALFYDDEILFYTNDGIHALSVEGIGELPESCWQLDLSSHDFGWVDIETGAVLNFTVENCGSQVLQVSTAMFGDEAFEIYPTDFTLTNGQVQSLTIGFNPTEIAWYGGTIQLTSDAGTHDIILEGKGYFASTPPVLSFVDEQPFGGTSGVSPTVGPSGTFFEYRVVYTDADNDPPMNTYPKVGIDFNGDQDFLDPGESFASLVEVDLTDTDYTDGKEYSYITTLPLNAVLGYRFEALDNKGNPATGQTAYHSGPTVSDDMLDLAIYANDISFSNNNPEVGDEIVVYATIHNTSDYPANDVPVNVYIMDELVYETTLAYIAPQSSAGLSFNHIFTMPEYYPVEVQVDENDSIPEDNELNNFAIRAVVVGEFQVPGAIAVTSYLNSSQAYPYSTLRFYGHASYENTRFRNSNVSGAQVVMTIHETGASITGYTNSNGDYSIYFTVPGNLGNYTVSAEVTDFTLSVTTGTHGFSVIPVINPDLPPPPEPTYLPDLVIRNWNIGWSGNPVIGEPQNLSATFSNTGNLDAFNIWLYVYIDGVLSDSAYYPTLAQGSSHSFSMQKTFTNTGNHSVSFVVDPNHLVQESNESNNSASATKYIYVPEPDLTPVDLWFTDNSPLGGEPFGIIAKVKNLNWATSAATTVNFYLDNTSNLLGTVSLSPVVGGSVQTISLFDHSINQSGFHSIIMVVDPGNIVTESNESNQEMTKTILIEQPLAELTVSGITPSGSIPQPGDPMNFMFTVCNNGSAPAENFYVKFLMDGETLGERILIEQMNVGECETLVSDIWLMEEGSHQVSAIADDDDVVPEPNNYNNQSCRTLGIDLQPSFVADYPGNSSSKRLNILVGSTLTIHSRLHNNGPFRAWEPSVTYLMADDTIGTDMLPYVNANIYAASQIVHTFTETGYFTIKAHADITDEMGEINEGNNIANLYIRVYEDLPDLEILSQHIAPSKVNPELYESIDVTATWFNEGNVPANPFSLKLYADDVEIGSFDADTLLSGEEASTIWPQIFWSGETGTHVFRVELDPNNAIEEVDETNNVATRAVIVGDAPDLLFSATNGIVASDPYPDPGDYIQISSTVRNIGGTTGTAMLNLYSISESDTSFIEQFEISVHQNDSVQVVDFWECNIPFGKLYAEITGSWPPEFNLDNNDYTINIGIEPPAIITDPESMDLCEGDPLNLFVLATGTNLQYRWFKDDVLLTGETLNTLNLGAAGLTDAGIYFCEVYNPKDTVRSVAAEITVTSDLIFSMETADVWICETQLFTPQMNAENYSSILWYSEGDGTFDNPAAMMPTYYPGPNDIQNVDVDICVTVTPITPCVDVMNECVQLFIQKEPEALAGDDATICEDAPHQLSGMVYNSVDFIWTSAGDGTFDDATLLEAVYTPGNLDAFNGFAELSLTAQPAGPCTVSDMDALILSIQLLPVISTGGNATIYATQDYPIPASAQNYSNLQWQTSGDGTFSDVGIINAVYTPGEDDIDSGSVELCVFADPVSPCILQMSDCMTLTIIGAINSNFTANPQSGMAPLTVQFTDLSTGGPESWQWDFNFDGTIDSEEQHPEWIYNEPGLYTVSLAVSDGENVDVETRQHYISVNDSQILELSAGWNDISSYLLPGNPEIENLIDPISGEVIILQNLEGFYYPSANVNTLGNWNTESGYFIKLSSPATFSIDGAYIPNPEIPMEPGWNLLPVLSNTPVSITKLFAENLSRVEMIKDGIGLDLYWLEKGILSLQELVPGQSYFVKVNEAFTLSFADVNSFNCGDVFTDERDGQEYETVLIGDQCWMAENLNVGTQISGGVSQADNEIIEKYCYDNDPTNCETFGGLYQWNEMMQYTTQAGVRGICPENWHIPSDGELTSLNNYVGQQPGYLCDNDPINIAKALASTLYWENSPDYCDVGNDPGSNNATGFNGMPGGHANNTGTFDRQGRSCWIWSSTQSTSYEARFRGLHNHYHAFGRDYSPKHRGYSVRCLMDEVQTNLPPSTPSSPIPVNGSVNLSIEADLSWSCYDPEGDPLSFDVYFGTDENPPLVSEGQSDATFDPGVLESNTNYFWKVVAYDNQGNNAVGNVWSFTTLLVNLPPVEPSDPNPENGAINQSIETDLSWICSDPEGDPLIYIVYFGKGSIPDLPTSIVTEATFDPGLLENNALYFWKIIALDNQGNFTESVIWSFQTEEE